MDERLRKQMEPDRNQCQGYVNDFGNNVAMKCIKWINETERAWAEIDRLKSLLLSAQDGGRDDEEPVDEAWLLSIGAKLDMSAAPAYSGQVRATYSLNIPGTSSNITGPNLLVFSFTDWVPGKVSVGVCDMETTDKPESIWLGWRAKRGQVRRLCSALGITPESKEGRRIDVKVRPLFAWYDFWIGVFYDRQKRRLYVLPIPCCGLVIDLGNAP